MNAIPKLRCAIYTRKSSEEGLDQEFNSLDAQFEACTAFIASQVGLGWKLVPDRFDDGGISGGTMERPALQRLLQEIRDRKIDVVVVYKIDRLTRSLMDFSRIVEIFDASNASFVSVTQQFNTTTSMGRLTLNVLLSFAQFEREVTAERIRDKIAASKKKGMWMGGRVPLGYRVVDRKLIIDEIGAIQVRHLFQRYLELGSVTTLVRELKAAADLDADASGEDPGWTARNISRGHFYHLLSNPIYIGKIRHRDQIHDGEHQAIIDFDLFEKVQALLAGHAPARRRQSNSPDIHLLTGYVFDESGDRLSPTHANNHGKRYRYYVSHRLKTGASTKIDGWRVPASDLDRLVLHQIVELLTDRKAVSLWIAERAAITDVERGLEQAELLAAALRREARRHLLRQMLQAFVTRVTLSPTKIRIDINTQQLVSLLLAAGQIAPGNRISDAVSGNLEDDTFVIERAIAMKRRGQESRIVVDGVAALAPEQSLVDLIAKAHHYLTRLCDGSVTSIAELASQLAVHRADISRVLPLAFLSPGITGAILTGRQPANLTARRLSRLIDIAPGWSDQASALRM